MDYYFYKVKYSLLLSSREGIIKYGKVAKLRRLRDSYGDEVSGATQKFEFTLSEKTITTQCREETAVTLSRMRFLHQIFSPSSQDDGAMM